MNSKANETNQTETSASLLAGVVWFERILATLLWLTALYAFAVRWHEIGSWDNIVPIICAPIVLWFHVKAISANFAGAISSNQYWESDAGGERRRRGLSGFLGGSTSAA